MASFSSRGPFLLDTSALLKPDILAPGVDILVPVVDGVVDYFSGTSMVTPHMAGVAAVIKSIHPEWSPMIIKSVLITSVTRTKSEG
jgi:subtilisin family serine protease